MFLYFSLSLCVNVWKGLAVSAVGQWPNADKVVQSGAFHVTVAVDAGETVSTCDIDSGYALGKACRCSNGHIN